MNTTDLPAQIRQCVDADATPITFEEIRARATLAERPRRLPLRRSVRLGVLATGVAAMGVVAVGIAVAPNLGRPSPETGIVLTAATLNQVTGTSRAAMTSGQADIAWADGGSTFRVNQQITFDGANWNDVVHSTGSPAPRISTSPGEKPAKVIIYSGPSIERVVDGKEYHYPAIIHGPGRTVHFAPGWMVFGAQGTAGSLNIPDPRELLGMLSPKAGFVKDGSHLHATTPGAVPTGPLSDIVQSEPTHAKASSLDVWVGSSNVVREIKVTLSGTRGSDVSVTVTFSRIGQPQTIVAPAKYTTFG